MKSQSEIKEAVLGSLKRSEIHRRIKNYLLNEGFGDEQAEEFIRVVKEQYRLEKLTQLPRKNRIAFYVSLGFFIVTVFLFFYLIPHNFIYLKTLLSIFGSVFISISGYYIVFFFNSWKKENLNPEGDFLYYNLLMPLMVVPAIILFFVLSWNSGRIKDTILMETKVETSGVIIDGSSVTSRHLDFSDVYIVFITKDGKKIKANYETNAYEFRNFFKGQNVRLIYSSENPENFHLLTKKEDFEKFNCKEDQIVSVENLMTVFSTLNKDVTNFLNQICYGWDYNVVNKWWENKNTNMVLSKSEKEIMLIGEKQFDISYLQELKSLGFVKTPEIGDNLYGIYESENMVVEMQRMNIKGNRANIITIVKK